MAKILVIDDERFIRNTLKEALEYEGYSVVACESCDKGWGLVQENDYDVIITDVKMEGMDGIEFLDKIVTSETKFHIPVIIISGHGNIDMVVDCLKKGAFDFVEKPLDLGRILSTVRNALEKKDSIKTAKTMIRKKRTNADGTTSDRIIGNSQPVMQVKKMISKVAPSEARVLVTGANGTGKEMVAREIHELSHRRGMAFIEVNCAAIPADLIESEMFGHEKGSFTSAIKSRKGKFEQAHGGTLFLDEIGDLSLSAQAKLLRALQEKKICRVGAEKDIDVDVRIISATNKNLMEEIEKGNFREDLYHRLSVVIIRVPTLGERRDDIPILIDHFIEKSCENENMPKRHITEGAVKMLQQMKWSGNVRELLNVVERLIVFTNGENVDELKITESDVEEYVIDIN